MAPKKRVSVTKASRKTLRVQTKTNLEVGTPESIFQTFATDATLQAGLCIVRPLGYGEYELINLDTASANIVGDIATAEFIKSAPERKVAMQVGKQRWDSAINKCDVAVRITEGSLFRLFKLPIELREKIYELVVFNPKGMCLRTGSIELSKPCNASKLMQTCRLVYNDCKKFFCKNNFLLSHKAIIQLRDKPDFAKNLVKISIYWDGKFSDPAMINSIKEYPNLKVMNISMWGGAIGWIRHLNRNHLHQSDQSIKCFNKLRGFDELASMRGLERVTFDFYGTVDAREMSHPEKDRIVFEEFLNRELTKPKPLSIVKSLKARVSPRKAKSKKVEEVSDDEIHDDEESEEEIIVQRTTRSRARKFIEESDSDFDENKE